MAGDVKGGRIVVPIEGDATGFREEAQARLNAATEGLSVKVPLDVDSHMLREHVAAAARLASAGEEIRLRTEVDSELLRTRVDAAAAAAELGENIRVGVELHDDAVERLRREVAVADRLAGLGQDVNVGVDRGGAANVEQEASSAAGGIAAAGASASSAAGGFSIFGFEGMAAAAAAAVLTGGVAALTGVLGGLVGGIAPVLGGLAALPGAFAVGGVALGTMVGALGGISKAVTALGQQQTGGGQSARQYADAQRAAAERVHQAQQSLRNTEYDVAHQRITDAHAVQEAEYNLQQAERSSTQATLDLTAARRDAARQLEDLKNQATDAALAAQGAQLDLEQARQHYIEVLNDPNATKLQREQAQLALDEAQQRLKEARTDAGRARDDNIRAQKAGVEGSQQVKSAVQQVADAHHAVQEAIYSEGQAQEQQSHDAVIGAQRIADAQTQVLDALHAQVEAEKQVGAGATAVNQAMKDLTPTARRFAEFLHGIVEGPLKRLRGIAQDSLIPGLQSGLEKVVGPNGLWPQLDRMVGKTGTALGSFFNKLGSALSGNRFRGLLDALGDATPKIVGSLGDAVIHFGGAIGTLIKAALPLLEGWARGIDRVAGGLDKWLQAADKNGKLTKFFGAVGTAVHQWGQIIGNVAKAIGGIFEAAWPAGKKLNDSLVTTTANWAKWVNSAAGQNKIKKFFDDAVPVAKALGHFIEQLVVGILKISNNKAWTSFLNTLTKVVPPLAKFAAAFGGALAGEIAAIVHLVGGLVGKMGPLAAVLGPAALGIFNLVVAVKAGKAIKGFVDDVKGLYGALKRGIGVATSVVSGIIDFVREGKLAAAATKVWTGIQAAFNLVMDANPVVLIALAVIALGVAFYEAYKHSKTFRDVVDAIGRFFKRVFLGAIHEVVKVFQLLSHHLKLVLIAFAAFTGPVGIFVGLVVLIIKHWHQIVDFFEKLPGRILDAVKKLPGMIGNFFENLGKFALSLVHKAIDLIVDVYVKFPLRVIKGVWHLIEDFGRFLDHVLAQGLHALEAGVGATLSWFGRLPGRVFGAIGDLAGKFWDFAKRTMGRFVSGLENAGQDIWNAGKDIITGLLNGIVNGVGDIGSWVKHNIVDKFLSSLKHGFGLWSPSRVMRGHGRDVIAGFLLGLLDDKDGLSRAATAQVDSVLGALKARLPTLQQLGKDLTSALEHHLSTDELMGAYTAGHPVLSQLLAHSAQQAVVYQTGVNPYASQQMAREFGIGVRDIIVHNPVPEPASTSVSSQLRRRRVMRTPPTPPTTLGTARPGSAA